MKRARARGFRSVRSKKQDLLSIIQFSEALLGHSIYPYQRTLLRILVERGPVPPRLPGRATAYRLMKEWIVAQGVDTHATVNSTGDSSNA